MGIHGMLYYLRIRYRDKNTKIPSHVAGIEHNHCNLAMHNQLTI